MKCTHLSLTFNVHVKHYHQAIYASPVRLMNEAVLMLSYMTIFSMYVEKSVVAPLPWTTSRQVWVCDRFKTDFQQFIQRKTELYPMENTHGFALFCCGSIISSYGFK